VRDDDDRVARVGQFPDGRGDVAFADRVEVGGRLVMKAVRGDGIWP